MGGQNWENDHVQATLGGGGGRRAGSERFDGACPVRLRLGLRARRAEGYSAYYAPTTAYYAPMTTYYEPAASYYVPTTT